MDASNNWIKPIFFRVWGKWGMRSSTNAAAHCQGVIKHFGSTFEALSCCLTLLKWQKKKKKKRQNHRSNKFVFERLSGRFTANLFCFKHLQHALATVSWAVWSWAGRRGRPGHLWFQRWRSPSWLSRSSASGSPASHSLCQESSCPSRVRRNNKHAPLKPMETIKLGLCPLAGFLSTYCSDATCSVLLMLNKCLIIEPWGYIIMDWFAADFADLMQLCCLGDCFNLCVCCC